MKHRSQILIASTVAVLLGALIVLIYARDPAHVVSIHDDTQTGSSQDGESPTAVLIRSPGLADPNVTPYLATTYSELIQKANLPSATIDASLAAAYANDICQQYSHPNPVEPQLGARPPAEEVSERFVRGFSEQFCLGYSGASEPVDPMDILLTRAKADQEALLVSRALEVVAGGSSDDLDSLRESLRQTAVETESPYIFMTANEILASPPFREDRAAPNTILSDESLVTAQQFAALLATCSKFSVCGPRSLLTVRACMPFQCEPTGSVRGYVQRRLNVDEFYEAERMAREIEGNKS
jgi:hypothetical protein